MSIRINGAEYETTANKVTTERGDYVGLYSVDKYNNKNEDSIGTYYLADNPALFEPQRLNNFKLIIYGLDGLRRAGVEDDDTSPRAVFDNAENIVTVSVKSCDIPSYSQSPIAIKRGNGTLKYAGTPTFNGGSIEVNDWVGAEIKDIFLSWQNLSFNVRTQKVGLAGDYKKRANLIEYSPDMQPVRTWNIEGCWISNLTFSKFSTESGNSVSTITAKIEYDHAYIDVSDLDNENA